MASDNEIFNSRLLGYIKKKENGSACVSIVAYRNSVTNERVALERTRARKIFHPDGEILAPEFVFKQFGIEPDSFIECWAKTNRSDSSYYKYAMSDNFKPVKASVRRIVNISRYKTSLMMGFITQDEISNFIDTTITSISTPFYLKYGNFLYGLFKYDSLKESICPTGGKDVFSYEAIQNCCINFEDKDYYIGNEPPAKRVGIVDCMDDDQLADWFKDLLQSEIISERFLPLTKEEFRQFTNRFKEKGSHIDETRLARIESKILAFNWTHDELKRLLESDSELTKSLKNSLRQTDENQQLSRTGEQEDEKTSLQKNIEELSEKKKGLQQEIDELSSKKDELEEKYLEKDDILQKSLSEMERKRDSLKQELTELEAKKQELQLSAAEEENEQIPLKTEFKEPKADCFEFLPIKPVVFPAVGDSFTKLEEEVGYDFFGLLRDNIRGVTMPEEMEKQLDNSSSLFRCQACFIPSVSWAYWYAAIIRNAKLYVMHVEHDWLHYKDFLKSGLMDVLKSCYINKSVNHILVLDSLNLTQPECGLKPFLDAVSGFSPVIPPLNKPLPVNLKIFATILPFGSENRIGLPLSKDSFTGWGQVATPNDKIVLKTSFMEDLNSAKGFFTPKDVKNKWKNTIQQDNNGYFAD